MLEALLGNYFFVILWSLSISIVLLIVFVLFLKRDVLKKLNEIIAKPETKTVDISADINLIKQSQEKRDRDLETIIKQHKAFVKFLYNVAKNSGKIDIDCFEVEEENLELDRLEQKVNQLKKERRRSSLFDIYDNK